MCYLILWCHALCHHLNHAHTTHIRCLQAIKANDDCFCPEIFKIPMFGFCGSCSQLAGAGGEEDDVEETIIERRLSTRTREAEEDRYVSFENLPTLDFLIIDKKKGNVSSENSHSAYMPFSNFSLLKNRAAMVLPLKIRPSSAFTACSQSLRLDTKQQMKYLDYNSHVELTID